MEYKGKTKDRSNFYYNLLTENDMNRTHIDRQGKLEMMLEKIRKKSFTI